MGASAGRVLLISKGDWNANTTYTGLDWVRHNGAAWVCKNTCTNIEPTLENADNWQMMARDGDGVTADTAMSDTSTNAVQNKIVKSYVDNSIAGISDMTGATATQNGTHGFVPAPQAGDEKKVLLGDGTWGAIDDKFSFSDHDTATSGTSFTDAEDGNMLVTDWTKNLLNPTLKTCEINGVTCTKNGDGTYTLNGTASANTFINMKISVEIGKTYNLIGFNGDINMGIEQGIQYVVRDEYDPAIQFTKVGGVFVPNVSNIFIYVFVMKGITLNNVLFKPMLTTDITATYDDFVPYGGYEIQSCGKNLLDNVSIEDNTMNIEAKLTDDAGIKINGTTPSGSDWKDIYVKCKATKLEKGKTYCLSVKDALDGLYIILRNRHNSNTYKELNIYNRFIIFTWDKDDEYIRYTLTVKSQQTFDNVTIYPQLEEVAPDTTEPTDFEPYTSETITVTNETESPAFGLKSHKGITNIIRPGNVKCVYPTNESGKGVLDAMYNNELSKLKNAILTYKTKEEYDAAVANNEIPDGATVIKDYDD